MNIKTQYAKAQKVIIGGRLRAARERAGIAREEVARVTGVESTAIKAWERGSTLPCLAQFRDLVALYGCSSYGILFGDSIIELTIEEQRELRALTRQASAPLRRKVDLLIALLADASDAKRTAHAEPPR